MEQKNMQHGKLTIKGDWDLLPKETFDKLIQTFDTVYFPIWQRFGDGEPQDILYAIESAYTGIAYTAGYKIGLNPQWLIQHPNDIDCMTHELIHAAQHYPSYKHSWLVEGIADYGRDVYGQHNQAAGWKLPSSYQGGKLTDGYRTTAAFLRFLEIKYPKIVDTLHTALRNDRFSILLFQECTGKTAEELWESYTKN